MHTQLCILVPRPRKDVTQFACLRPGSPSQTPLTNHSTTPQPPLRPPQNPAQVRAAGVETVLEWTYKRYNQEFPGKPEVKSLAPFWNWFLWLL